MADLGSEVLHGGRHESRRADEDDPRSELAQAPEIGAGHARVGDVAHDGYGQAFDPSLDFANGEQVEQALGGVLVLSVAGVDDRDLEAAGQVVGGSGGGMPAYDDIHAHGLDVADRVTEGFALRHGRLAGGELKDIGGQSLGREREARASPGGFLEERVHDDAASQGGNFLDAARRDLLEALGGVENAKQLLGRQRLEVQKVSPRPNRTRHSGFGLAGTGGRSGWASRWGLGPGHWSRTASSSSSSVNSTLTCPSGVSQRSPT